MSEYLRYVGAMLEARERLTPDEVEELESWEMVYVGPRADGSDGLGTSDWPGWAKYIGQKPRGNRVE